MYQIKVSQHGPIVNDLMEQIDDKRPIAMQWIYTKLNNELLEVGYDISHSNSLAEFKKGAARLHAPGLNMMYGDAKNNIAWFASGKLYEYREGINRKLILDGASGKDEILEYYDFEENPQAINPSWNYVYSANNQPDSIKGGWYPGYYLPEDRAKRIVSLLKDKKDFTKEDVAKMMYDVTSATVASNITTLATELDTENYRQAQDKAYIIPHHGMVTTGKTELLHHYNRLFMTFKTNYQTMGNVPTLKSLIRKPREPCQRTVGAHYSASTPKPKNERTNPLTDTGNATPTPTETA